MKTQDLTGKVMKSMSLFYSLAIRKYPDDIVKMSNEIWAGYYHRISTDENPQHQKCDISWCKYLKAQAEKQTFKHDPALSKEVQEIVEPIFESLTEPELLQRCLGGNNQNNNESFNNCLWSLIPKNHFHGKDTTDIDTWISVSTYNEGLKPLLLMLSTMGTDIGQHAYDFAVQKDEERIFLANKKSQQSTKDARIQRKKDLQEQEELFVEASGLLYGAGIAD